MASKKNISVSSSKVGMNKDAHLSNLKPEEYTHAKNSNFSDDGGNSFNIQNEHSNLLANRFKGDYKVIGLKNDIYSNSTYYFLVNLEEGISEIGRIKNINNLPDLGDDVIECEDCEYKTDLSIPLEDQVQTETQSYETILNDECNSCLNFDINFPIKSIEIKNEKCGRVMYFTDNNNSPRYIELDHLDQYSFEGEELCGDDSNVEEVCVACEKMEVFKTPDIPNLEPTEIVIGGNLRRGTYEFLLAYSDENGNEVSRYFSITNPISIFDQNNNILDETEIADRTNFAIKLNVSNLDKTYTHYKVAVIQTTDVNFTTSYYVEGIHSTSDNTILYTTDRDKSTTSLSELNVPAVRVERWETLTSANGYLFGNGITYSKRMNLQPVMNLMGLFLNWQTNVAKEGLYKDGVASSKYRGYFRDEVYPLGIRFLLDGEYSPTYHFIGRPPTETDLEEIENRDRDSVDKLNNSCTTNTITQRWQLYNTARELGSCTLDQEVPTVTVSEVIDKLCTIEEVDELNNGTISIPLSEGEDFVDLETYIEDNRDFLISIDNSGTCSANYDQGLCDLAALVNPANHPEECSPDFEGCDEPTLLSEEIEITVEGDSTENIPREYPEDYSILPPPQVCSIYTNNSEGGLERDTQFEEDYFWGEVGGQNIATVYKRNYSAVNENCNYPEDIIEYNPSTNYVPSYFFNYYGGDTLAEVQTSYLTHPDCFTEPEEEYISEGALWFRKEFSEEDEFIIDITPQNTPSDQDQLSQDDEVRINIFDSCGSTSMFCEVLDPLEGVSYKFRVDGGDLYLTDDTGVEQNLGAVTSDNFLIVLDCPIVLSENQAEEDTYVVRPTSGCFGIVSKPIEFQRIDITYDNITTNKNQTYRSTCYFETPSLLDDCATYPHKFGEFSYVESTAEYPDNEELYNSSSLNIAVEDLPDDEYYDGKTFREYFEDNYVAELDENNYVLDEELTDFRCKPIRNFKMPDNNISPFMYESQSASFSDSIIYPLGLTINEEVINSFLDIALKNNLITQKQRNKIQGYEIVRGDRRGNESIVAKGVTFDMMQYEDNGEEVLYSNYPLNDLGSDRLHYESADRTTTIPHPYNSEANKAWTFDSPDTNKDQLSLPSFMKVEGFMYGRSRIQWDEVREHPEWVILGGKLKNLASTLATLEVIAEGIINIAQSANVYRVGLPLAPSVNPIGIGLNIAVAVISTVAGVVFNYARYKYEWLRTFKDLGAPENFAYYSTAVADYNYFKPNIDREGDVLRYLNIAQNIQNGRLILTDSIEGERITVNHKDREKTVLLSAGEDHTIEYPTEYINYDNSDVDSNTSSRTFASENNACSKGLSREVKRNAASMYVSLKNYLPEQYGTVGSVKWLTTGYRGDLTNPRTNCLSIFGGDIFITRNATLRRFPFFLSTAMNIPSLTPYRYKFYTNIGEEPRFYCNYEFNTEDRQGSQVLPDIDSDYVFDCFSGKGGNYIKEPSKFYLYYNGIANYLVESPINVWNRYGKPEPWNNFYPNERDYMEWTQEVVNPIRRQVPFFYNETYSKNVTQTATLTLPDNYDKEEYDCKTDSPNGTMYSLPDNSENAYLDPWLIYRPLDRYEFPSDYGKLIELRGIETAQVLGRFENQTVIFNAVDELTDNGQTPDAQVLGTGGIFARRPRTFATTDLGYLGTQTSQMVSCEYGHFTVDAERGQVFKIENGGQGIEEISSFSNGEPSGMRRWFKKHLPFKIKKYFPEADVDNPWNDVGITMGWDSVYKRVLITKKDYIPKNECLEYDEEFTTCEAVCPEGYTFNSETNTCERFVEDCSESIDVVFVIDATTSQTNAIDSLKNSISSDIIPYIENNYTNYRLGLVTVWDRRTIGEALFDINVPLAYDNSTQFISELNAIQVDNQGNTGAAEPTDMALQAVLNNTQEIDKEGTVLQSDTIGLFNNASPKAIFLTADTPPSGLNDDYDEEDWLRADSLAEQAEDMNIQIFSILTSSTEPPMTGGLQPTASFIMNNYAEKSGGEYYFKSNGIGVDDSVLEGLENVTCYFTTDPVKETVEVSDTRYFEDVSWTIAFYPETGKWGSFYDFKPNYYVSHNEYFQTGINTEGDEKGVWSHLLTNKSFNVFYGKAYDWEIEVPVTNQGDSKYLESFSYELDVRRYKNEYDFYNNKKIGFEEVIIWNQSNCSGNLNLKLQQSIRELSKYPKTNGDTQTILQTMQDGDFRFNYFYNRVKDDDNMLNIWNSDINEIDKSLNNQALSFYGKSVLERLRGDVFLVNLKSSETQHKKIFKIAKTKETIYDK